MTNHPKFTESHDSAALSVGYEGVREIRKTMLDRHGAACWYFGKKPMNHDRDNVWCCPEYKHLQRDTRGRKLVRGMGNGFLVYRCLCPECPARIALLMGDVDRAVGLEAAR